MMNLPFMEKSSLNHFSMKLFLWTGTAEIIIFNIAQPSYTYSTISTQFAEEDHIECATLRRWHRELARAQVPVSIGLPVELLL